ncbi:MAG: hypothetical protein ABIE14_01695, partial [Patescibacteria group bacterium]
MAETKNHFDIPLQNPTGTEQTFGQKIEELKTHSDTEIAKTASKISKLKNEIETKISSKDFEQLISGITYCLADELINLLKGIETEIKVGDFLDKNPSFEMDVKNKIHSLRNAPKDDPKKTIYENTLFFLEMSFRQLLVLNLKATGKEADLQEVTVEFTENWIANLEKMADGPTLEYHELPVPKAGVYAPEVKKLLMNPQFLRKAGELAEAPNKKEFISAYLQKWATVAGGANAESATRFLNESHATMMREVGEGHLSLDEFREVWEEISKDPAAAKLLNSTKNGESKALENFNKWLNEKDEAQIIAEFAKKENLRQLKESESNSNPHGFGLRKWGDLGSALLFFGNKIFYGIALVNLALARFNPIKMLSNPVALGTTAILALITNRFNPSLFKGKTDI